MAARTSPPTIMVINKADNPRLEQEGAEFYALGMDPAITVSAQHGRTAGDLADMLVDALRPAPAAPSEPRPRVSFNGKPLSTTAVPATGRTSN